MYDRTALDKHLAKCKIEYIAKHGGGYIDEIKGEPENVIPAYLRELGFKIKERFEADGKWIRTTGGISVYLGGFKSEISGYCIKLKDSQKRKGGKPCKSKA